MMDQLLIRNLEEPFNREVEKEINWVCESFGFFEKIDKQKTAAAIFRKILVKTAKDEGVTTTEIIEELNLSRVAVLNHIKRLMSAGLIIQDGNEYYLRSPTLYRTIREVKRDIDRVFQDMETVSREVDVGLGLKKKKLKPKKPGIVIKEPIP